MPKLPLFENEPLNPEGIVAMRQLFAHPEKGENMALIDDLLDLHANPAESMTERLFWFVAENGLIPGPILRNMLSNSIGYRLEGKRAQMRLEMHQRVLAYAAAAGFLPLKGSEKVRVEDRQQR
jgi:hypothetical protein